MKTFLCSFKDFDSDYGGWFDLVKIEVKDLKTAKKRCAEMLSDYGDYDDSWMNVEEVKK